MKATLFAELMESAHEAAAHARGEISLRTTVMPRPPARMRSADVKRVRAQLRASQALFAGMLNVSPRLVQAWEAGRRAPRGPALVLLNLIKERPELLMNWHIAGESGAAPQRGGKAMKVTRSSGNVFADLGLPAPEERLVKAGLASALASVITARKLTQTAAADIMGIDQPKVSHLLHGRLEGFSTDRLVTWLTALGRDVEIIVRTPARRRRGRVRVHAG